MLESCSGADTNRGRKLFEGGKISRKYGISYRSDFRHENLYRFQCALESQQKEYCDVVVQNSSFYFSDKIFTAQDFYALGYIISVSSYKVTNLHFRACSWDKEAALCFSISKESQGCLCLQFSQYEYREGNLDKLVESIAAVLNKLPYLHELDIYSVKLNGPKIEALAKCLNLPGLKIFKMNLPIKPYSSPEYLLNSLFSGNFALDEIYLYPNYLNDHSLNWSEWMQCLYFALGHTISNNFPWNFCYNQNLLLLSEKKFSYCTIISLINCSISDSEAKILSEELNCSVLKCMTLDFNRISDSGMTALSACIAKCGVLQEISIQCNNISDKGAVALAGIVGDVRTLKKLDLQGNLIADEGAVAIAKATETLTNLHIYLCGVNITEEGVHMVMQYKEYAKVRALDFNSPSWIGIESADIKLVTKALLCGTLPILDISRLNIKKIAELISISENLRHAVGLRCSLECGDEDFLPELYRTIASMNCLQMLELKCFIDVNLDFIKDLEDLHVFSSKQSCNLDFVRNCSKLHYYATADISNNVSLFSHLQTCTNLRTLDISSFSGFCVFVDDELLHRALMHCKKLQSLNLSHNNITDHAIIGLSECLTELRELNIADNEITSRGILSLSEFNNLQFLNIANNPISSNFVQCVSKVLERNPIRHFDISRNNILFNDVVSLMCYVCSTIQVLKVPKGMKEYTPILIHKLLRNTGTEQTGIVAELQKCTQLVELDVSGNCISQDIVLLAEGLKYCSNLCKLYLGNNKIVLDLNNVPALISIIKIMEYCSKLQELDLSLNNITIEVAVILICGWRHKNMLCLDLDGCVDKEHEVHLTETINDCTACKIFLELYYNNNYLVIQVFKYDKELNQGFSAFIPKKILGSQYH